MTTVFVLQDMRVKTRSRTLPTQTQNLDTLKSTATALITDFLGENTENIRRLGVTVSNLGEYGGQRTIGDY